MLLSDINLNEDAKVLVAYLESPQFLQDVYSYYHLYLFILRIAKRFNYMFTTTATYQQFSNISR